MPLTRVPLDSIEERLRRLPLHAADQLSATANALLGDLLDMRQIRLAMESMVSRRSEILSRFPAFLDVMEWVEVHWSSERELQPPNGTVPVDSSVHQEVVQPDFMASASRLYLAAARYGAEEVASHAIRFASHGMVQTQSAFLLRGPPPARPIELDAHTALIPYREAMSDGKLRRLAGDMPMERGFWPPDGATDVSILRTTIFENRGRGIGFPERHISPLLRCGIEPLVLLLGLVWGVGLRLFGDFSYIPEPVAAALPQVWSLQNGAGIGRTSLILPGFGLQPTTRPFDARGLADLVESYAALPDQERNRAALALRRLRDSRERDGEDGMSDRAIDLAISLEAMFMEAGEAHDHKKVVSRRASWHYADSTSERVAVRKRLQDFYGYRNDVAHGNLEVDRGQTVLDVLDEIDNVARTCLKTMMTEGRPRDWEASKDLKSVRQDPPRKDTEIPSTKSDSLSWSMAEQKVIDAALESVWKPEVDGVPAPAPGVGVTMHMGVSPEEIERCRRDGIAFTIAVPARLYLAHPMWLEEGEDPDERVMYYCGRDVERHLRKWQSAASDKAMHIFALELESPENYLPRTLPHWRELLQAAGL